MGVQKETVGLWSLSDKLLLHFCRDTHKNIAEYNENNKENLTQDIIIPNVVTIADQKSDFTKVFVSIDADYIESIKKMVIVKKIQKL